MDDASLAAELVRNAGTLAAQMLADGLKTEYKTSRSDVVSAADHEAEQMSVARLRELRPDDGVVGEEGARRDGDGRIWYLDPVDGTYNFLSGLPYWCSAVGLADQGSPVVGAVYYAILDQLWLGGPDLPTTLNGVPVARLIEQPLGHVSVTTYFHPRHLADQDRLAAWQAVIARAATVRMLGSASVDLAGVASGRLGVFLQADLHPWDWVPGAALVIGAGGVAEELQIRGNRWHVAGNRQAVDDALAALSAS